MASNNHNAFASSMPLGRVSEHLDYFNDSIAAKHCILDGDFDDIFGADFDLVFDPDLILGTAGADHSREQRPHQVGQGHEQHQQRQQQQHFPLPVAVCSSSFVPPPTSIPRHDHSNVKHPAAQHAGDAVVSPASATPPVTAKPMVKVAGKTATSTRNTAAATTTKSIIRKTAPAVPSPTSVTAVFESIPTPKSSPRKRSVSAVEECNAASFSDRDESNLSFQEQEDLRRERNRHHAKRSRQRKRDYMTQLEDAVNDMRKENERLFDLLGMDSNRAKADMNEEHERKKLAATERFVTALKQPRNRVLDNTTLAFLRELWK